MSEVKYRTAGECDRLHSEADKRHNELVGLIKDLNDRLYKDNGKKSIQSILNDHAFILRIVCWLSGIAMTATITGATGVVWMLVKKQLGLE